jgi:AcrR family transcriptional regulator
LNKFNPESEGARGAFAGRGERTRQLVLDTALRLFREQGYDKTTMRGVAAEAGLSLGNAYYYFPSKQHLVLDFYAGIQAEHRRRCADVLSSSTSLARRLAAALHVGFDTMAPYHGFAASFIKVAIDPDSPLSPFSAESAPSREAAVRLFADIVDGSTTTMDDRLRGELPELLWLAYLGLTLFWIYDRSPDQTRTRALIDGVVPLLVRMLKLTRVPLLRAPTTHLLGLLRSLRP